jgi:hypothetical protein
MVAVMSDVKSGKKPESTSVFTGECIHGEMRAVDLSSVCTGVITVFLDVLTAPRPVWIQNYYL